MVDQHGIGAAIDDGAQTVRGHYRIKIGVHQHHRAVDVHQWSADTMQTKGQEIFAWNAAADECMRGMQKGDALEGFLFSESSLTIWQASIFEER